MLSLSCPRLFRRLLVRSRLWRQFVLGLWLRRLRLCRCQLRTCRCKTACCRRQVRRKPRGVSCGRLFVRLRQLLFSMTRLLRRTLVLLMLRLRLISVLLLRITWWLLRLVRLRLLRLLRIQLRRLLQARLRLLPGRGLRLALVRLWARCLSCRRLVLACCRCSAGLGVSLFLLL